MPVLVEKCVPGVTYLVDCNDGHPPCLMTFLGQVGKSFQFRDEAGGKAVFEMGEAVEEAPPPPPIDNKQLQMFVEEASKGDPSPQTDTQDKPETSATPASPPAAPPAEDKPAAEASPPATPEKRKRTRKAKAEVKTEEPPPAADLSPGDFFATLAREIAADLVEDRAQHDKFVCDLAANPKATAPAEADMDKVAAMLEEIAGTSDTSPSHPGNSADSNDLPSEETSIYMLTYNDLQVIVSLFQGRCRVPVRALSDDTLVLLSTMGLLDDSERKFVHHRLSNLITGKETSSSAREDLHLAFKPAPASASPTPTSSETL